MDFISKIARHHCKGTASRFFFLITAFILSGCAAPAPRQPEAMPPVIDPAEHTLSSTPSQNQPELEQKTATRPGAEYTLEGEPYSVPPIAIAAATDDLANRVQTLDYIEQRLTSYEKKFQQWLDLHPQDDTDTNQWSALASDSCLDKFNALLSGYTNLRNQLQLTVFSADMPKLQSTVQEILQLDIAFIESDCEQGLSRPAPRPAHDYSQGKGQFLEARYAEKKIDTYFNKEQYGQVIAVFQLLTNTYPTFSPSLQTLRQYGLAQLNGNDIDEATDAFIQALAVFDTNGQAIKPWTLQRQLADLLLASGRSSEARKMYEKLLASSDSYTQNYTWATRQLALLEGSSTTDTQMTYYLDLVRAALVFNMKSHNPMDLSAKADKIAQLFPNTPVADNAIWIKQDFENQHREWIDKQLNQVAVLTEKKEFQQAQTLLSEIPPEHLPADLQGRVRQATVAVKTVELHEQETQKILLEESLASQWKSSDNLLDSQQYDPAIAGFTHLLDSSYDAKARNKIQEATNLAAAMQRKQAATLFIKAVKTQSPENKKELLLESRKLLQEVLKKYPQADIIDKVAQNLTTLEQHIEQFDPTLLEDKEPIPMSDNFADKLKAPDQMQDHGLNDTM
jgi:tetratricopeptide (TPR) repeat protein